MEEEGPYARAGGRLPGDPVPDPGLGPVEGRRISYARTFVHRLPALLLIVGAFYDYFTPQDFTAAPFFTAAPLVAAPLYSRRGTVLTGLAAVVVVLDRKSVV